MRLLENKIYKIVLYGSYARGDFDTESDVNIIILLDNCTVRPNSNLLKEVIANEINTGAFTDSFP